MGAGAAASRPRVGDRAGQGKGRPARGGPWSEAFGASACRLRRPPPGQTSLRSVVDARATTSEPRTWALDIGSPPFLLLRPAAQVAARRPARNPGSEGQTRAVASLGGAIAPAPRPGSAGLADRRRARARPLPLRPRDRGPGGRRPVAPACNRRARHVPALLVGRHRHGLDAGRRPPRRAGRASGLVPPVRPQVGRNAPPGHPFRGRRRPNRARARRGTGPAASRHNPGPGAGCRWHRPTRAA